jgi:hypothetical protein
VFWALAMIAASAGKSSGVKFLRISTACEDYITDARR